MMCRPRPGRRCGDGARSAVWEAKRRGLTEHEVLTERATLDAAAETRPRRTVAARRMPLTETGVAKAYADLVSHPGDFASLASLRASLAGSREQQDAALLDLERQGRIRLVTDADLHGLTDADRGSALHIDGSTRTLVMFEGA